MENQKSKNVEEALKKAKKFIEMAKTEKWNPYTANFIAMLPNDELIIRNKQNKETIFKSKTQTHCAIVFIGLEKK